MDAMHPNNPTTARACRLLARELYDSHELGAALWSVYSNAPVGQYPALDNEPDAARTVMALVHTMPAPVYGIASERELTAALSELSAAARADFDRLVTAGIELWLADFKESLRA